MMNKDMKDLKFTPGPWQWHVEDYSQATLHGKDYLEDVVMTSEPCGSCRKSAEEKGEDWKWGRCTTPNEANAKLIAKAPEMYEALKQATKALERVQPDATIPEHLDACKAAEEALETINKLIP